MLNAPDTGRKHPVAYYKDPPKNEPALQSGTRQKWTPFRSTGGFSFRPHLSVPTETRYTVGGRDTTEGNSSPASRLSNVSRK